MTPPQRPYASRVQTAPSTTTRLRKSNREGKGRRGRRSKGNLSPAHMRPRLSAERGEEEEEKSRSVGRTVINRSGYKNAGEEEGEGGGGRTHAVCC